MVFGSFAFVLIFLPLTLAVYYAIGPDSRRDLATLVLIAASLVFYAAWDWRFVPFLLISALVNFWLAGHVSQGVRRRLWLSLGVGGNLVVLGYFKYCNFFLDSLADLGMIKQYRLDVVMPLGISFFTFQKIAFLVDCYRSHHRPHNLLYWVWFVFFFPQLVAGPIVHHAEMAPQFRRRSVGRLTPNLAVGLGLFTIGLFKKIILADSAADFATPVFTAAEAGSPLSLLEAWGGALCYTVQIYFDFSGYSDMALGLARMFGFRLPINFHSPYKATGIIDFWRRWHMTLSRFLRDYLYIPLGGNRAGPARRQINLAVVMLLGGLWHGASWTFVIWGGLHGLFLMINHGWRGLTAQGVGNRLPGAAGRILTFVAVVTAWVFFRADTVAGAVNVIRGMAGLDGFSLPVGWAWASAPSWMRFDGILLSARINQAQMMPVLLAAALGIAWFAPNSVEIMGHYRPTLGMVGKCPPTAFAWRPSPAWAMVSGVLLILALFSFSRPSVFIYWMF